MHFNAFHQSGKVFGHYAFQCFLSVLLSPLFLGLLLTCMLNTFMYASGQSSGALFLFFHSFFFLFLRWDISVDFRFVIPIFASSNPILNTSTGFFICIVLLFNAKISTWFHLKHNFCLFNDSLMTHHSQPQLAL